MSETYARYHLTTTPSAEDVIPPLDLDRLTIREIYAVLREELPARDDAYEYCSLATRLQYEDKPQIDQPIGACRWIACYAVTGGSEGHYVHVDRIYQATEYARDWTHEPLFLVKTFGGYERACELAAYIGARLSA